MAHQMPPQDEGVIKDPDAVKLFIGQIPRSYSEEDLTKLFGEFGEIYEVMVLRDRATNQSKGCAFLTFTTRQSADLAMEHHHENTTLDGMSHPLQVKIADSDQRGEERKLFIGMISRQMSEDGLRKMFEPFGVIEDVAILRTPEGVSRGCAFVKYETAPQAAEAISALHHSQTMEGCRSPIVVKLADNEREKQQRRQRKQYQYNMMYPYMRPPMFPMFAGQQGQFNGGMYESDNTFSNAYQPFGQFNAQGFQNYMPPPPPRQPSQREGPDGANLFIYHLPQEFNDAALASTFAPFGTVISAKVFVDKYTGQSKCFGFVSYDNAQSAAAAISAMNGFQIGMKRLKVQLKRPKSQANNFPKGALDMGY